MQKKKRKPLCQLTFQQDRLVLSRAAAEHLPEYIDMYEHGGVLALKGNLEGKMRLSMGSHKYRQNIRAKEVLNFVRKKYECEAGDVLTAWYRDDVLMFCKCIAAKEAKTRFNDSFQKIEMAARPPERYSVRTRGHVTALSGAAGRLSKDRLTVYEHGELLAFVPDSSGSICPVTEKDGRTKSIRSRDLTDFIRQKYGVEDANLVGWERNGVLFCSDKRDIARIPLDKDSFIRHDFQMSRNAATVNILQNSRLLISNLGASVLGEHISLYECGGVLALANDTQGDLKTVRCENRAGCDVTGRDLVRYVRDKFSLSKDTGNIMPAVVRADVLYFSTRSIDHIPAFKQFEKVNFNRVCSFHVVSVTVTPAGNGNLYISKAVQKYLTGNISAYYKDGVWALTPDPDGVLHMNNSGVICNRQLAQLMQDILHFEHTQRFYIKVNNNTIFFSHIRFQEGNCLNIAMLDKVLLSRGTMIF